MHIDEILDKLERVLILERRAINEEHIYSVDRIFKIRVILIEELLRYDLNKLDFNKKEDVSNRILNILDMNEENIKLANYKRKEICRKISDMKKTEKIII